MPGKSLNGVRFRSTQWLVGSEILPFKRSFIKRITGSTSSLTPGVSVANVEYVKVNI